jgi:hypothetical protein
MSDSTADFRERILRRHLLVGWWGLLLFLSLGIILETLHGFKLGLYLDPANKMRRLLWTLSHAHGTLLALMQIALAVSIPHLAKMSEKRLKLTSFCLIDALVLLPLGFFLGGINPGEGDPGVGVLLVPVGAAFLLVGVLLAAISATSPK